MIFHLAGGSSVGLSLKTPEEDFRRSVDSTIQLLEWTRNHAAHARLVLASSAAVYGAGYSRPICETDSLVPYSPYGYHKRMAELLFESYSQNFGLLTAVVRLFSVYGPELRKQLLWDLCNRCKTKPENLVLAGSGLEMRDWLHVSDAVAYLNQAAMLANSQSFVVNGGRGVGVAVKEIAELVRDTWHLKIPITFNGSSRTGDPHYLVANVELARSIELVPKIDWQEGIKEYIKWFQQIEGK
jgi:UDP-glucose 4-epimerase